jgi:NADH-quinone oxidoreductase subunit N
VLLLVAGLGFKLSLVPFHVWTPQAYAGGSDAVAAFLAGTSKVAALAALVVVLQPLASASSPVLVAIGLLAAASMTVGNLLALVQDDPVRLLAWSTVAQAGWVVLPLSALAARSTAAAGAYLLAYVVATLVAFCVVHVIGTASVQSGGPSAARGADGTPRDRPTIAAYTGLLRTHPLLGGALGLALLSLAGLPPGFIGLVAKIVALQPVVGAQQWVLAVVAVANAVLGIAVYLRWFAVLLRDPDTAQGVTAPGSDSVVVVRRVPAPTMAALLLTGTALVVTSILPELLMGLVQ